MNGSNLNTKLLVLDGKNWNRWMIQMRVLFRAQDVLDLVTEGYVPVAVDATEEEKVAQRETRKRDQKELLFGKKGRKSEEANIVRGDSDDEPVLLMAYESDEELVSLSFSNAEGEEDSSEYSEGVFLYDSESEDDIEDYEDESESEVSEEVSELEDDSEAEDKLEREGSEEESEDELESHGDSASEGESERENSDDDPKSGGDHTFGRENSDDVESRGQASKDDNVFGVNHDVEGGTSEVSSLFV
ncbi:uncharacterized protein LOC131638656 [Vicia villosa]|uniref:uncharacterized protein LOC131638656 n=1 Tax=Vicia villosa TaxID=3911 RepID=UPI00273CE3D7|nr:uncharacterized protein LOC131638656 [Vicia villosa]